MNDHQNSLACLITEILLIVFSLMVIIGGIFLALDYKRITVRDNQRRAMIRKVQEALENFYQTNGYYPGSPYRDENNLLIYPDWHYLITCQEMKNYYYFAEFRDPCQPQEAVGISGVVTCPTMEVNYQYAGVECQTGCKGYKLEVRFENGLEQEFLSQSVQKRTNE